MIQNFIQKVKDLGNELSAMKDAQERNPPSLLLRGVVPVGDVVKLLIGSGIFSIPSLGGKVKGCLIVGSRALVTNGLLPGIGKQLGIGGRSRRRGKTIEFKKRLPLFVNKLVLAASENEIEITTGVPIELHVLGGRTGREVALFSTVGIEGSGEGLDGGDGLGIIGTATSIAHSTDQDASQNHDNRDGDQQLGYCERTLHLFKLKG